jgi:hypothetical protein
MNMTTNMCEAYPDPAPKCPMTFGMGGCCVDGNLCGANLSLYGMGCRELGAFGMMVPGGRRGFAMVSAPTHCDGTPVPMPDGGMTETDAGL